MDKKVSTLSLAMTITGTFIGAGFASGSELWQFFGIFGKTGLLSMFFSLAMLCVICIMITRFCVINKRFYLDTAVFEDAPKIVNTVFCSLEMVLYFFFSVIMTSAFVALIESFIGRTASLICGFAFITIVGISLFFGLSGLVKLFSFFVPFLVAATVIISIVTITTNGITFTPKDAEITSGSPLLRIPALACFLSLSYNFFGSIGVLAPLSKNAKSTKQITFAAILGIFSLGVIASAILLAIFSSGAHNEALPMLEIAKSINPVVGIIYAIFLSSAMFGCSYSSSVCTILFFEKKFLHTKLKKIIFIILYVAIVYSVSLLGFTDLISTVYPIFGYVGFALIIAVIYNSISYRRK